MTPCAITSQLPKDFIHRWPGTEAGCQLVPELAWGEGRQSSAGAGLCMLDMSCICCCSCMAGGLPCARAPAARPAITHAIRMTARTVNFLRLKAGGCDAPAQPRRMRRCRPWRVRIKCEGASFRAGPHSIRLDCVRAGVDLLVRRRPSQRLPSRPEPGDFRMTAPPPTGESRSMHRTPETGEQAWGLAADGIPAGQPRAPAQTAEARAAGWMPAPRSARVSQSRFSLLLP